MDYDALLELGADLGYGLQYAGGEIHRVEESVNRLFQAYGISTGAVYAIPNCLIVSLTTPEGHALTRVRRVGYHGTDIASMEAYNALCRSLCAHRPPLAQARQELNAIPQQVTQYNLPWELAGSFLTCFWFALFFSGTWLDGLAAGLCGLSTGLCLRFMSWLHTNLFFKTAAAGFVSALAACALGWLGIGHNVDTVIIGALMTLVPGVLFTNFIRDTIGGDTMTGLIKLVEVVLISGALALGTGAAMAVGRAIFGAPAAGAAVSVPWGLGCLYAALACAGFCILYNVPIGPGLALCCLGGGLGWLVYLPAASLSGSDLVGYFAAGLAISLYSEIMARIRRCPVTGYLLVSFFPLVPGAGLYYTLDYFIRSETAAAVSKGTHTLAIAVCLAVGVLLMASAVRMWLTFRWKRRPPHAPV